MGDAREFFREKLENIDASLKLAAQALPAEKEDTSVKWRQAVCEFGSTLGAGIAGAVSFSLAGRAGIVLKLAGSGVSGGSVKYGTKALLENMLLEDKDKTLSGKDFAWGVVDGWSGVAGSLAEARVARAYSVGLGRQYLGTGLTREVLEEGGKKVLAGSLQERMTANTLRGLAGGAAGSFAWSVPHRAVENWEQIKTDTGAGLARTSGQVIVDTTIGTVFGGVLSAAGTGIWNWREIAGLSAARLKGDAGVARVITLSWNDMHSELAGPNGLPRLSTKASELRQQVNQKGHDALLVFAGDAEGGNVLAGFTRAGTVEHQALGKMRVDAFTLGNHAGDVGCANKDIITWLEGIAGRDLPGVVANIDLPTSHVLPDDLAARIRDLPRFKDIFQPYRVVEVAGAAGKKERIGIVGLVTNEIVDNPQIGSSQFRFMYRDHVIAAREAIADLHRQGVDKVVVLSHLGKEVDTELARKVEGISAIIGAHSHDVEPLPFWVKQDGGRSVYERLFDAVRGRAGTSRLDSLKETFFGANSPYAGWEVPVIQAGSKAQWLAEMNIAFKASGAADKFRTSGRLHQITESIPADAPLEAFINAHIEPALQLMSRKYGVAAARPYDFAGIRFKETELGNLVSDALLDGVNRERAKTGLAPLQIMLKHSGDLRDGIPAGRELSHYDYSNVFLNTGSPEVELAEMATARMTGADIKRVLEFGIAEFQAPPVPRTRMQTVLEFLKSWVRDPQMPEVDYKGNFSQVSGLKYSFDLSRQPRDRITGILVKDRAGNYVPIDPNGHYDVLTLMHPVEKWAMKGVFADTPDALRARLQVTPVKLSQVDLLADYIARNAVDGSFRPSTLGALEGRISNQTPLTWRPPVRPGPSSLLSYSGVSSQTPWTPNYSTFRPSLVAEDNERASVPGSPTLTGR